MEPKNKDEMNAVLTLLDAARVSGEVHKRLSAAWDNLSIVREEADAAHEEYKRVLTEFENLTRK